MRLVVRVTEGTAVVDGRTVTLRGRWDACVLGALVSASSLGRALTAPELNERVRRLGRSTPLERTELERSFRRLEADLALQDDSTGSFRHRLHYARRARTVGPWSFRLDSSDEVAVDWDDARLPPTPVQRARLSKSGRLIDSVAVSNKLAVCHALWADGSRDEAIRALNEGSVWELASEEINVHRLLQLGDAYGMAGQAGKACEVIEDIHERMNRCSVCFHHRGFFGLLTVFSGFLQTKQGDLSNELAVIEGISRGNPELTSEIDYRTRTFTQLIASVQSALRLLSDSDPSGISLRDIREVEEQAMFGVYYAITGLVTHLIPFSLEATFGLLVQLHAWRFEEYRLPMLRLQQSALAWRQINDPPNSFRSGEAWLAHYVLDNPSIIHDILRMHRDGEWRGDLPNSDLFFQKITRDAESEGDPFSVARAALAQYRYAANLGRSDLKEHAKTVFLKTCAAVPKAFLRLKAAKLTARAQHLEHEVSALIAAK